VYWKKRMEDHNKCRFHIPVKLNTGKNWLCRRKTTEYHNRDWTTTVFLNRRAAARYRALASIIAGRERPEETTICCKISLVQLITNLNVILYLSTCHTIYISVLIFFMIMA